MNGSDSWGLDRQQVIPRCKDNVGSARVVQGVCSMFCRHVGFRA